MNLNEAPLLEKTKVLLYGQPKTGKTALAGKLAAQGFKLNWIDLERGRRTLMNPAILAPQYRENINLINIPDHRFNPVAIDTVKEILRGGVKKICHFHGKVNCPLCLKNPAAQYSTINILEQAENEITVIDSVTQLSASAINRGILKEISGPGGEEYKPTFHDYRDQGARLDQVFSLLQVLDINIICISHEKEAGKYDDKGKLLKSNIVPLGGTTNFSKTFAKYFDEVVYVTMTNKVHRAYNSTSYETGVLTGGRTGVILDALKGDELSLAPLFKKA